MSLKDDVLLQATLAALHDTIGEELATVKARVDTGLAEAKKTTGTQKLGAELPDGTDVATVTWVSPAAAATVTDENAFREWVRQHHPDQIHARVVVEVREAFAKGLLKEMTAAGVAQWCDTETGEVHTVPGVTLVGRRAYQRLLFKKTNGREVGKEAIVSAWREARAAVPGLAPQALPAAE
ncbi:hypothetical protein [Streptacidiphilus sp. MAP5-3]|uniref:hypothetical protein n=1 Tax=unclassified Streptacidiphilus TaxID=2643834 RepID=UPI0035199FCD